jgi:hypothetical protein
MRERFSQFIANPFSMPDTQSTPPSPKNWAGTRLGNMPSNVSGEKYLFSLWNRGLNLLVSLFIRSFFGS